MKRHGKTLKVLPDGAPRRMSDAKTAWRKMTPSQRLEFVAWAMPESWRSCTAATLAEWVRADEGGAAVDDFGVLTTDAGWLRDAVRDAAEGTQS